MVVYIYTRRVKSKNYKSSKSKKREQLDGRPRMNLSFPGLYSIERLGCTNKTGKDGKYKKQPGR